jgi:hypothetical protein
MVIFDLICLNGHQFEGWFADLPELEDRLASGELSCPVCGDVNIARRPSTFGLVRSRPAGGHPLKRPPVSPRVERDGQELGDGALKAFKKLVELSERLEKDYVDVGTSFTAEALKMHYGAAPARNIRGHSTAAEEETLKSEGIEFFKLPILSRKNTTS